MNKVKGIALFVTAACNAVIAVEKVVRMVERRMVRRRHQ